MNVRKFVENYLLLSDDETKVPYDTFYNICKSIDVDNQFTIKLWYSEYMKSSIKDNLTLVRQFIVQKLQSHLDRLK